MKRALERILALVAVILTGAFLSAVSGGGGMFSADVFRAPIDGRYFHAGKTPPVAAGESGCRSPGCHVGMPHSRDRAQAAFRNMHLRFVDCLVCHGNDSRKSWTAEPLSPAGRQTAGDFGRLRNRWKIAAPSPAVDRERMHGMLGTAMTCRTCHSEEGHREIAAKGIGDLPAGFANPVALRMIEEGAKQWIPDTMR